MRKAYWSLDHVPSQGIIHPSGSRLWFLRWHVDLTLALTRCSCSALREVGVFVRECGKCKPLYASVIERCVTLPVGTWSVARKQSFASTAVTCTMSQLRTSSERKLSLSATRQPFTVEIGLLFVFSLSNSLFFVAFFCLSGLSHTQEQAGNMPWMQAVAPSPSYNRDGSEKVRTFDKRTHRHKPFDLQRFVSVLWFRHAQLRDLVEV